MKTWQKISTITFSAAMLVLGVFLLIFLNTWATPKVDSPGKSSHAASEIDPSNLPTDYWTDYAVEPTQGSGTKTDPWHIYTAEQLIFLNDSFYHKTYYVFLEADIDLKDHLWTSIGSSALYGSLYLYGQNHTISNMMLKGSSLEYSGFVGHAIVLEVRDLNFVNATVEAGESYAGIVSGYVENRALFSNIKILSGSVKARGGVGGIIGSHKSYDSCTIENCVNNADISTTKVSSAGGIAGAINCDNSFIKNCVNYGSVSTNNEYAGGIVGVIGGKDCEVDNCINYGSISAIGNYAGGIVGATKYNGTIQNCLNAGKVTGSKAYYAGIVGCTGYYTTSFGSCLIVACSNVADIVSTGTIGGIVGYGNNDKDTIQNCTNFGTMIGASSPIGGLIGYSNGGIILRSLNLGQLTSTSSTGAAYIGGLIGRPYRNITISDSAFRGDIVSSSTNAKPLVGGESTAITYISCYYNATLKASETDAGTVYKNYVLGADETEETAFSSDIWVQNDSLEITSLPFIKGLIWVGPYLENVPSVLDFLKANGFTQAAA